MSDNQKNKKISMIKQHKNNDKDKLKFHETPHIYPSRSHIVKKTFTKIHILKKVASREKPNTLNKHKKNPKLPSVKAWKKRSPKERFKWVGFFVLLAIMIINTVYMTARFIDNDYAYNLFSYANIEAVIPDQDIAEPLLVGIVLIREIDFETLQIGDQVVVCCDYDLNDTNWVETVVSIDYTNQIVETTYDGLFSLETAFEDVYGLYRGESGFFGTLYYSATFIRGYLLIFISQILILYGYFYVFIKRRKDRLFRS